MRTKLKYDEFNDYLLLINDRTNEESNLITSKILNCEPFNFQWVFKFPNNYGASVIKHWGSYGFDDDLFELGVLCFDEDGNSSLTYNTQITDDVIGYLTNGEVLFYLQQIKQLERMKNNDSAR